MDLQELKKLIAVFEKSGVHELEIEEDGHRVLLKKESTQVVYTHAAQTSAPASIATVSENTVKVQISRALTKLRKTINPIYQAIPLLIQIFNKIF